MPLQVAAVPEVLAEAPPATPDPTKPISMSVHTGWRRRWEKGKQVRDDINDIPLTRRRLLFIMGFQETLQKRYGSRSRIFLLPFTIFL